MSDFVREYAAGRTPIPCVHCNGDLKFATLVERAAGFGADLVATGHYARVSRDEASGRYKLQRGRDAAKDQSYFLFTLTQAQLAHAVFPLGELDKPAVREHARALDLAVAEKPDSHEICFVASGDHAAFLEEHGVGKVRRNDPQCGGRRRRPARGRSPLHGRAAEGAWPVLPHSSVRRGDQCRNRSRTVGPREALNRCELTASGVNWIAGAPPAPGARVTAQIRHRHQEAAATIDPIGVDRVQVIFDEAAGRDRARAGAGDVSGG